MNARTMAPAYAHDLSPIAEFGRKRCTGDEPAGDGNSEQEC